MIKSIFSIFISGLIGLFALAFVLPDQASIIADQALGTLTEVRGVLPVALQQKQPAVSTQDDSPLSEIGQIETKKEQTIQNEGPFSVSNIIDATNKERIANGFVPLKANTMLTASAKLKVDDMIARQYFEHSSPTGEGVSDLGKKVGYDYILMGENLALGNFTNAEDLLTAWMNSPGHRANILNTGYQEIGVYATKGTYEGRTVWFAVQHFGTARGACPNISEQLRLSIDTTNTSLKNQEKEIEVKRQALEAENHPQGAEYQKMVLEFNALVEKYNKELATSKTTISTYNAQVRAFNSCLSLYQK